MAIVSSELKLYKAEHVSDTPSANGGRCSTNQAVSGVTNNLFPDVPQSERAAGSTKWRKAFFKVMNAADAILYNAKVFIDNYTQGDDAVYMAAGSHNGLESGETLTTLYGCGKLDVTVSAGVTSIQVLVENPAVTIFRDGGQIRISDRANAAASGNEEYVTISGTPSFAGSVATINFTPALANGYTAASTRVTSVIDAGTVSPVVSSVLATTAGDGDYNHGTYPITVGNLGTVYDDWTVTFSSSTAFSVAGAATGSVGTGNTLSDFSPINPNSGTPYFTIDATGFTGTWANGDTLTFRTTPAEVAIWLKRVVPAGAGAIAGNKFTVSIDGETA